MRPIYDRRPGATQRGRGRLLDSTWYVARLAGGEISEGRYMFTAERLVTVQVSPDWPYDPAMVAVVLIEHRVLVAHCSACAKVYLLHTVGGRIDARGAHRQGECGRRLLAELGDVSIKDKDVR